MTWPKELKQLDEDLAAGRLSPEEYLRRRDELLPGGGESDPPAPAAGETPEATPQANPFPPAFRWESSSPGETTEIMDPVRPAGAAPNPAAAAQGGPPGDELDSERTQVVQARPLSSDDPARQVPEPYSPESYSPESYSQASGQGWDSYPAVDSSAPPWVVADLPPVTDQQSGWVRQGPETFAAPSQQPRTKQILGIALVAVLVIALLGAAVAFVLSQGSDDQAGGGGQQAEQPAPEPPDDRELPAPPPPSPEPVDVSQALIEPPGQLRDGGGPLDLPRLESDELLSDPIVAALRDANMTEGILKTTRQGENTIAMFALTVRDQAAAADVASAITTVQREGGLQEDESRLMQGVMVLGTAQGAESAYRAVYVLYDRVIFLEVLGPSRDAVLASFDSLLDEQVRHAPPTLR